MKIVFSDFNGMYQITYNKSYKFSYVWKFSEKNGFSDILIKSNDHKKILHAIIKDKGFNVDINLIYSTEYITNKLGFFDSITIYTNKK